MQATTQKWMIHIYCHLTTFPFIRCWLAAYNGPSYWDIGAYNISLTESYVLRRIYVMDTLNKHWGYLVIWNISLKVKSTLFPNLFPTMELNSEMKTGPNVTLIPKSILIQSVLQIQKLNNCQLHYSKMQVTHLALIQDELSQEFWILWAQIWYSITVKYKTQGKGSPTIVR